MGRWSLGKLVGAGVALALLLGSAPAWAQTDAIPVAVTVSGQLWLDSFERCVPGGGCYTVVPKLRVVCHPGTDSEIVGGLHFTGSGFHYAFCKGNAYAFVQWVRRDQGPYIYEPEGVSEHVVKGDPDRMCAADRYQVIWIGRVGNDPELMQTEVVNKEMCIEPPSKPTIALQAGHREIVVSWTKPAEGTNPIKHYELEWVETGAGWTSAKFAKPGAGVTSHTIGNLSNGTEYSVRLRAHSNEHGSGAWSDTARATPTQVEVLLPGCEASDLLCATLSAGELAGGLVGFDTGVGSLSDPSFTYNGSGYVIASMSYKSGSSQVSFGQSGLADLKASDLHLHIGAGSYAFSDVELSGMNGTWPEDFNLVADTDYLVRIAAGSGGGGGGGNTGGGNTGGGNTGGGNTGGGGGGGTPPGPQPAFPSGGGPGAQSWIAGVAIAPLSLPAATGGDGTLSYAVSGLPAGVAMDPATRRVSGTPAAAGSGTAAVTATDADGDAATLSFAWTVTANLVPEFGGAAVADLTFTAGRAIDPAILPAASGGNGALTHTLTSAPAGLAGLSFDPATRRLSGTPSAGGSYVFTYRADDADADRSESDAAVLRFAVTVESALSGAEEAVRRTLAAVGMRTLGSALANIGARLADALPGSELMLAGQTMPFGAPAIAAEDIADAAAPCEAGGYRRHDPGVAGSGEPGCGELRSHTVGTEALLGSSAFSLRLGAGSGGTKADPLAPLWSVWGRGDLGSFGGSPEDGPRYRGETRTGWLGLDARAGPWVAGLALSRGTSEAEYQFDGTAGKGRLETTLTALYPYGRWTLGNGLELRGVLGAGTGEARHMPEGGARETGDLAMRMGSAGLRRALPSAGGVDLAVRGDASLVRMEIGDGPATIAGVSADSWRLRAGVEASRRLVLSGDAALTPFAELVGRRDGGDGLAGTGLEVAGGARYAAPGMAVEARGRWLAAHTEAGTREHGVSVTARFGPGAEGRGLSLSLSPRWGAAAGPAEALWRHEMPRDPGRRAEIAALDARIGYGVAIAPRGLLTPFAETGLGSGDRRVRLGARFEATPHVALGVALWGEHRESGGAEPEHSVRLDLGLRF